MTFFLSYESTAPAIVYLQKFQPLASAELNKLSQENYGDELTDIAIISIVVPEDLFQFLPERKLFQRKSRSADIRLRINFQQFLKAKPEQRYKLYCDHILESVETLRHKVSSGYLFDALISDISEVLSGEEFRQRMLNVKKWP